LVVVVVVVVEDKIYDSECISEILIIITLLKSKMEKVYATFKVPKCNFWGQ